MDAKKLFSKVELDSWQTVLQQLKRLIIKEKKDEIWKMRESGISDISIPLWEDDFHKFYEENKKQIDEYEQKRLMERSDNKTIKTDYIQSKIDDTLFMYNPLPPNKKNNIYRELRRRGATILETDNQLSVTDQVVMKNMVIDYYSNRYTNSERWHLSMGGCLIYRPNIYPARNLYSAQAFLEIDENLPRWIDEAQSLEREFNKREKIERLNANSAKVLVKNKMQELGCEYKFYEKERSRDPQSHRIQKDSFLEIKLQKSRKFTIKLPYDSFEKTRKILDALAGYISAVNSVPMNFKISNSYIGEEWNKAEDNEIVI